MMAAGGRTEGGLKAESKPLPPVDPVAHPIHPGGQRDEGGRSRTRTYVRSSIVNMTQRRRCHATIYLGLMGTCRLRRRERERGPERRENEWLKEEEAQKGKNDEGTAF